MNKIPVIATALNVWRFTFENYLRIIGVVWAPMAVLTVTSFVYIRQMIASLHTYLQPAQPAAAFSFLAWAYLFDLIFLFVVCIASLGVARMVLGLRIRSRFFYFAIDRSLWRYFGWNLLVVIMSFVATTIVVALVTVALFATLGASPGTEVDPEGALAAQHELLIVVMPIMYGMLFFLLIRFASLLAPVALLEDRFGPIRNWELTRGNSWRIFAVYFLVLLPLLILGGLEMVAMRYFLGAGVFGPIAGASPSEQIAASESLLGFYVRYGLFFVPLAVGLAPLFYGPFFSTAALCYRAIVPESQSFE